MKPWRPLIAFGVSVTLHAAAGGVVVGMAVWQGWKLSRNVDIELVSTRVTEVKELPLGPPPPPKGSAETAARRRARARARAAADDGVKLATGDGGADGGAPSDGGNADAGARPDAGGDAGPPGRPDASGPRPRDLRDYGPEGSRLTALLRLDRLRDGPQAPATIAAVDQLLRRLPDRRRLIDGTGLDLYRDFDALLIATPDPMDDAVTFLAVRHHLTDQALMAALGRGADTAGRPIVWRTEGGRPVGSRRPRRAPGDAGVDLIERDDRLLVLPRTGLAIIAPPAYAGLLLPRAGARAEPGASEQRWRDLVARIDDENSALPDDAVLMMTASNVLGAGRRSRGGGAAPELSGPGGLPLPPYASVIVGVDPRPFLETTAEFARAADAKAWEARWPGLKQTLLGSPLLLLSGFGSIVARAEIQREDGTVTLRTTGTHEELRRVLGTISQLLGGGPR
jgi:hypothetical protein